MSVERIFIRCKLRVAGDPSVGWDADRVELSRYDLAQLLEKFRGADCVVTHEDALAWADCFLSEETHMNGEPSGHSRYGPVGAIRCLLDRIDDARKSVLAWGKETSR